MIYGMYLSATGVITSAYRQDLIANNLANSQTTGFKRDLASFYQRLPADQENPGKIGLSNALLDKIGGGTFVSPTRLDSSQGGLEVTGNNLDLAILGQGFFTVAGPDGQPRLTRDGRFRLDSSGKLTLSNDQASPVLDAQGKPIVLDPTLPTRIDETGQVLQSEQLVAKLGIVGVADPSRLKKEGGSLLTYPGAVTAVPTSTTIKSGYVEGSNVDPANELSELMDTQRELEANANMIRYQDETLGELVNTVGKVG
jgi:flagellar basal-body rod protein FlgG